MRNTLNGPGTSECSLWTLQIQLQIQSPSPPPPTPTPTHNAFARVRGLVGCVARDPGMALPKRAKLQSNPIRPLPPPPPKGHFANI